MYQQHFGLAHPFSGDGIARDEAIFRTAATDDLVRELGVALNRKDSVALLYGGSGTGKSTIAQAVLKELGARLAFAPLNQHPQTPHELLEQILSDFGLEVFDKSHVERGHIWRQFICEAAATDTRVCLLVEDAENLNTEVLKSLHQLTAADAQMSPGCNVILTTNSAAVGFLDAPGLQALSQRIRLRRRIDSLNPAEVESYINFKCERAGVSRRDLFAADVGPVVHERTGGVIRVIDNLLESALCLAAAVSERVVTADAINRIADTQFGLPRLDPQKLEPQAIDELLKDFTETTITPPLAPTAEIPTLTEFVPADATARPAASR